MIDDGIILRIVQLLVAFLGGVTSLLLNNRIFCHVRHDDLECDKSIDCLLSRLGLAGLPVGEVFLLQRNR